MKPRQFDPRNNPFPYMPTKKLFFNESKNEVLLDSNAFNLKLNLDSHIDAFPLGQLLLDFVNIDFTDIISFTNATIGAERTSVKQVMDVAGFLTKYSQDLKKRHIYFYPFGYNVVQHNLLYTSLSQKDDNGHFRLIDYSSIIDSIHEILYYLRKAHHLYKEIITFCYANEKYQNLTPVQRFYIYSKLCDFELPNFTIRHSFESIEFDNVTSGSKNLQKIEQRALSKNLNMNEICIGGVFGLLYFELIKLLTTGARVSKCKNCGKVFNITGRSDTAYCEACKDVGPQNAYRKKVNSDPIIKLFNRAYKRYHQKVSRKTISQLEFLAWLEQAKTMRAQAQDREISFNKYKEWIEK
jgi:hypothetical protein